MTDSRTLASGFISSVERFPQRTALAVDGANWTYRELYDRTAGIANVLDPSASPLFGVFAARSATAFAGILASLMAGAGFVPLNPAFPIRRTRQMLVRSGCQTVIGDLRGFNQLDELLQDLPRPLTIVLPDCPDVDTLAARWPQHTFLGARASRDSRDFEPRTTDPASPAYLLFTSGSTGVPKGVAVPHRSVRHFVAAVAERYGIHPGDRFTQMFDLTFDLSMFDMFVAWDRGACVCCPSAQERNLPGPYIKKSGVTVWFSVPSTALQMQRLRMLREGQFPGLRLSLFCGEALTADIADAWSRAAPNSVVENLYGPTEATIACTAYRWDGSTSLDEVEHGIVPIGQPLPGSVAQVVDDSLIQVAPGGAGELLVGGPQLAIGYWNDPDATRRAFVTLDDGSRFYRTGDLVRQPLHPQQPLKYLGRIDHQIKIQGYRVEIGEVEAAVRDLAGVEVAVAIGWPVTPAGAEGIVVFLEGEVDPGTALLEGIKARLPRYMVPHRIVVLETLPLNANGKIDRRSLRQYLDDATTSPPSEGRQQRRSHR